MALPLDDQTIDVDVRWRHASPCSCGRYRWWIEISIAGQPPEGVGWAHADGTKACEGEGA